MKIDTIILYDSKQNGTMIEGEDSLFMGDVT